MRADLVADFVCRLLTHMKQTGSRRVTVQLRPEDEDMPLLPWIDPENLNPRYLVGGMHAAPARMAAQPGLLGPRRVNFRRSSSPGLNSPILDLLISRRLTADAF